MMSCLLCIESVTELKAVEITQEICLNFTIKDAIEEYFTCSKAILESHLKFICNSCYKCLENFHIFASKVNKIYKIDSKHEDSMIYPSNDRHSIAEDADSFVDDLIEYDEYESVEFEDNDGLCDNNDDFNGQELNNGIRAENEDDLRMAQPGINELSIQSPNLVSQSSSIHVILANNLVKISDANFQILSTEKSNLEPKSDFSDSFQELCSKNLENDSFRPQNSGEYPSPNLNLVSHNQKNLQYIQNPPKNDQNPSKILQNSSKNLQKSPKNPQNSPNSKNTHKCEICIKNFKTSAILKSHIQKIHSDTQSPSICQECGKVYTNKYILKTHMRKHIVDFDRIYECYICKKSLKNLPHLLDHFKYKHDPAYSTLSVCHICSKTVTRLDIHLRQMHPTEPIERIKCEICGHFMKKSSFKGHMASHTQTGFNCEDCGKYLKNRNSLLCHMKRVHTSGKYKCEHCDKAFHQEGRLMDHIACQHTGVFLHKCRIPDCEKKFRNAGRRRMHERRMHPEDYDKNFKASYLRENLEFQ